MSRIETNILINRPVEEVWEFMAQPEKMPTWSYGLKDLEQLTDGPLGVGTRFSSVILFLGREERETQEIVAFEPYRHVAFRVLEAGDELIEYTLEPVGNSTNLILHVTFSRDPHDPLPEPIFIGVLGRYMRYGLETLKDFVEFRALVSA